MSSSASPHRRGLGHVDREAARAEQHRVAVEQPVDQARRTRRPRRRRSGCRPCGGCGPRRARTRSLIAAWSSVVVKTDLEHRPHPVEHGVGPCGVEAGVELDLEEALGVLGAAGRPDLVDAAGLVRPAPTEGHRQQPDGAHAGPVQLLGERRDDEVAVLAGELDDRADRATAVERGPVRVDDPDRDLAGSARRRRTRTRRGRPRPARRRRRAAWPRPRAAGRLRRTASAAPGGSAARSSSWSVTLFLDGSATSATRPPGVGARVGRSAAIGRDRGRRTHGGSVGHGCLG